MHVTADATVPGALGTFGFDDEGTPARAVDLVRDGIWVGVLSGRDSARLPAWSPGGWWSARASPACRWCG